MILTYYTPIALVIAAVPIKGEAVTATSAKPATPIATDETATIGNTQSLNILILSFDDTFAFIVKWTAPVSLKNV